MKPISWGVSALLLAASAGARFPLTDSPGVVDAKNDAHASRYFGTPMAGVVVGSTARASIGFFDVDYYSFLDFQSSGLPLKVTPAPGVACTGLLIPVPTPALNVEWTDGANGLPVRYAFHFGTSPVHLPLRSDQSGTEFTVSALEYLKPYFWQVTAYDAYGRQTKSDVYPVSLSPPVGEKFYCAPNPFRAGVDRTTFFFALSGNGSATITIYAMPHQDLVYTARLDGLSAGIHTFSYDGRDADNRVLNSGLYIAKFETRSDTNESHQLVRFVVAR